MEESQGSRVKLEPAPWLFRLQHMPGSCFLLDGARFHGSTVDDVEGMLTRRAHINASAVPRAGQESLPVLKPRPPSHSRGFEPREVGPKTKPCGTFRKQGTESRARVARSLPRIYAYFLIKKGAPPSSVLLTGALTPIAWKPCRSAEINLLKVLEQAQLRVMAIGFHELGLRVQGFGRCSA